MAGKATAVDIGSHGIRVMQARVGKTGIAVTGFAAGLQADGLAEVAGGVSTSGVTVGLAGRAMMMRYMQVPEGSDAQLGSLMDLEIEDIATQSGAALSADYNVLQVDDDESGMDTVMLALARNEALDAQSAEVASAGGSISGHVPNCVALFNAWIRCGQAEEDQVVCLVNMGHETIDLAIVRGFDLLVARNLPSGGRVLDDAIAAAFSVGPQKAEALKKQLLDLDPASRGRYASGQAEKVTLAAGGAASAFVSAIQSSVAFCKSTTKIADLELDKVVICGGSARLNGIRGMLREALRCPVELFDPFETCDLSGLDQHAADLLESYRLEAPVVLGLAIGRLEADAYDLTILPEAVKRRREFLQKTVWNIAAAVVIAVTLFLTMQTEKTTLGEVDKVLRRVRSQVGRYRSIHDQAEETIAENQRLLALNNELSKKAVPLHGLLHTLRLMQQHLPREIYLTSLETVVSRNRGDSDFARIKLEGTGREVSGRNVLDAYNSLLTACRAQSVEGNGFSIRPTPPTAPDFEFSWLLDFAVAPEATTDSNDSE